MVARSTGGGAAIIDCAERRKASAAMRSFMRREYGYDSATTVRADSVRALIDVLAAAVHDPLESATHDLDALQLLFELGQFGCGQLRPARPDRRCFRKAGDQLA